MYLKGQPSHQGPWPFKYCIAPKPRTKRKKGAHSLSTRILHFFNVFFVNGHLNQCQHTDILKLYTEISSLTPIFHEKAASTGSRGSFQHFERHCSKTALYEKK